MIKPYFGEFLIIPMPLELSLERCSNACGYCFSNLNGYEMRTGLKSILNQLDTFNVRKDHGSFLLAQDYSLCFSNRSDPFCKTNYKNAVKLCELFTELNIDVAYQTKGGPGIGDALGFIRPSIWYVTICQDDDDYRKRIEPNAISISERLKLIEKLVGNGHQVNVGINPFVPEWIKNKAKLVSDIKNAGAYGITVEGLHFSHEQVRRMRSGTIEPHIIQRGLKKHADDFEMDEYRKLKDIILESGLQMWSFWNDHPTDFWAPYYEKMKCFPILTNFTNWVFQNKKHGDLISFEDFCSVMSGMPDIEFKIDSYVLSINRGFKNKNVPVYGNAKSLLKIFWSEPQLKTCPTNHPNLAIVAELVDKKTVKISGDLPVYMFVENGINSAFVTNQGEAIL